MPDEYTDWEDDSWDEAEDWADDPDDDEEETAHCPECRAEMSSLAERCPVCGYWLTEGQRYANTQGAAASERIRQIGVVLLVLTAVAILASALAPHILS